MLYERMSNKIPSGLVLRNTLQSGGKIYGRLAWSPDGKILASTCRDQDIQLWDVNSGSIQHTLQGNFNYSIAWSPDGTLLAASGNFSLFLWNTQTGKLYSKLRLPKKINKSVVWSPDGTLLAISSEDNIIRLWNPLSQKIHLTFQECSGPINTLAWSPDGQALASGSENGTLCLWNPQTGQPLWAVDDYLDEINSLVWLKDGETIAAASSDKTIKIWNFKEKRLSTTINAHTGSIVCIAASHDGHLLASKSLDGTVRIWLSDTGKKVADIDEPMQSYGWYAGLAFHPNQSRLATLGEKDTTIRIWDIDIGVMLDSTSVISATQYKSAKVVLVGDKGAGKTSLSLVLTKQSYSPPESTHGRQVLLFNTDNTQLDNGDKEIQETLLWDLAGQKHYRLIHQLYMNEATLFIIVFDAYNDINPYVPISYWERILKLVEHTRNNPGFFMKRFLVSTHIDMLEMGISQKIFDEIREHLDFDDYFATSPKEGIGITKLSEAIKTAIDWKMLPKISPLELFQKVKDFVLAWKRPNTELSLLDDLYNAFLISQSPMEGNDNLRAQFETCIDHIESQGLIKRLNNGNCILLMPELLDYYGSALIDAVLEDKDGLGSIIEEKVIKGEFAIPSQRRIKDKLKEEILLNATIQHLQQHEIVFREQVATGRCLIFPSLATREHSRLTNMGKNAVVYRFEGPIENIHATLAVRLYHSGTFKKLEIGKDAMTFAYSDDKFEKKPEICGILLSTIKDGTSELTISFSENTNDYTRVLFEQCIHEHLKSHVLPASIQRNVIYGCPNCAETFSMRIIERRRELGFDTIQCNICETIISISEKTSAQLQSQISSIHLTADAVRDKEIKKTTLKGVSQEKKLRGEYDVFMCYNPRDIDSVNKIKLALEDRGIAPCFKEEELQPGLPRLSSIEQYIRKSKAVAVFIGKAGLEPQQQMEVEVFHNASTKQQIPVIPVFLRGAPYSLELPPFLERMTSVDFRSTFSELYQPMPYKLPLLRSKEDDSNLSLMIELNEDDNQDNSQNLTSLEEAREEVQEDEMAYRDQDFDYHMDRLEWAITGKKNF